MHIPDGVLSTTFTLGGFAGSAVVVGGSLRWLRPDLVPRVALLTAAFFVVSLIHVPLGPASVHLSLHGLVGVVLGPLSGVAIAVALALQAILIGHGGITALGFNVLVMTTGAMTARCVFDLLGGRRDGQRASVAGFFAGALGVGSSALLVFVALWLAGEDWRALSRLILYAHVPIALVEGLVTAAAAAFLVRVEPDLLSVARPEPDGRRSPAPTGGPQ